MNWSDSDARTGPDLAIIRRFATDRHVPRVASSIPVARRRCFGAIDIAGVADTLRRTLARGSGMVGDRGEMRERERERERERGGVQNKRRQMSPSSKSHKRNTRF